ncbi:MAG: hypothetical protein JNM58_14220 [Xanthomonadaceae bacterium]|nr:hypothetical protein [Xanthomonadaceae bacterium]
MDKTQMLLSGTTALTLLVLVAGWRIRQKRRRLRWNREWFIREYAFPSHLDDSLRREYPMLTREQLPLVHRAMRSYFACWLQAGFRPVAMPSWLVDAYWHAFILDTRAYAAFCTSAFGRFFHHVPAALATQAGGMGEAMQRTWRLCCAQEGIAHGAVAGVPLLFLIDERIRIPEAMRHDIDSLRKASADGNACSSGCGGGCGGNGGGHRSADGHGDGGDSDGGGSGCGGGCGGD